MSDTATTTRKWERTAADDGYALCATCHGRGWCFWCRGAGRQRADTTKLCGSCAGKGTCGVCEGEGQLPEGHYALKDWKDDKA